MTRNDEDRDTLGDYIADVVDAATGLAERAADSAAALAEQAVRDAREVASSFEALWEAAARDGVDRARDAVRAAREATERVVRDADRAYRDVDPSVSRQADDRSYREPRVDPR